MRPLRVALLHPTYWPEVLRGSERIVHDIAAGLAARRHDVTLITSHPGRTEKTREDGFAVIRGRRPPRPRRLAEHELFTENVPAVAWRLLRGRFDLAHAFFPAEAWAALQAGRVGGPPLVHSYHGIPSRQWLHARRRRLAMTRTVVEGAAANTVLSEAAVEPFERLLMRRPRVLPAGVVCSDFAAGGIARAPEPTILSAASLTDPRKRGPVLIEAFGQLRERLPEARLRLLRVPDPHLGEQAEPKLPPGAEWAEPGYASEAVAAEYARAWVTALPAVDEALGLVTLESLAAGTPVVAADSGATPEILTRPEHGALVKPDDPAALAAALERALEPGAADAAAPACRERAAAWEWTALIGRYESLYEEVLAR